LADISKIEVSVLKRQCLAGRIGCIEKTRAQVLAWSEDKKTPGPNGSENHDNE
jgi:hypothetical protein